MAKKEDEKNDEEDEEMRHPDLVKKKEECENAKATLLDDTKYEELLKFVDEESKKEGNEGNKKDLYIDEKVKEETVRQYAESKNMKFKLVSAKEDPEGFVDFLQELLNDAKPFLIKRKKIELKNGHKNSNKCKC